MGAHDPHSLRDSWTGPRLGSRAPTHPVRMSCATLDNSLNVCALFSQPDWKSISLWLTVWHDREIPAQGVKLPAPGPNPARRW